ncbi:hypothetical protein [Flavobacterium sp.]|uniref:hypothetical protein n=1 Tax=Flavobacterium sp. TaxID=239 RepID=UPI00260C082F|nr:hypothetical protein [Flavobacterium sp.]
MHTLKNIVLLAALTALPSCETKTEAVVLKQIAQLPKELKEISGIAFSNHKLYTLEDSGNPNEITVIDTLGRILQISQIKNATNTDWEDLTFDTHGNLYIGDFGNNDNDRKDLAIYKIDKNDLQKKEIETSYKVSFNYPEQKDFPPKKKDLLFDVEAFFEYQSHFYLFTKNRSKGFDGSSYVYKIPNTAGHHEAKLIKTIKTCGDYHNCAITSAAIAPDGSKFVLLSHSKLWLFNAFPPENIADGKMTEIDLRHYSQKEAVCFKNKSQVFIADERVKKVGGNLYETSLKK